MGKISDSDILKMFRAAVPVPVQTFTCSVTEVNEGNLTIDIKAPGSAEVAEVRLRSLIDGEDYGFYVIPDVGSSVLVGIIGNDPETAFLIKADTISKLKCKIGEISLEVTEEKVLFNGGENGGLINIQTLVEQLNKTNEVVNAIKDSLLNWTPVASDGGAALKTFAAGLLTGKATGDFSNMEDDKVIH